MAIHGAFHKKERKKHICPLGVGISWSWHVLHVQGGSLTCLLGREVSAHNNNNRTNTTTTSVGCLRGPRVPDHLLEPSPSPLFH